MDTKSGNSEEFFKYIEKLPQPIQDKLLELLKISNDSVGDSLCADDIEGLIIEHSREFNLGLFQNWADRRVEHTEQEMRRGGGVQRNGKKNSSGTRH